MKFTIRLFIMLFSLSYVFSINYAWCQEADDIVEGGEQFVITHNLYASDSYVQTFVRYAYEISSWDMDFVTTLDVENNTWDMYRQSDCYQNWVREDSRWFCQLNRIWHKDVVDKYEFWDDPFRQLDKCREKYKGGTKFYWYYVRDKALAHFTIN